MSDSHRASQSDRLRSDADRNALWAGISKHLPKRKTTACNRCHGRKTRCSGEQPCRTCNAAGLAGSCSYAIKDRIVKVNESYLHQILAASQGVQHQTSLSPRVAEVQPDPIDRPQDEPQDHATVSNPLIEDRAWFVPYMVSTAPIYIGESACTAFASSLCRVLDPSRTRTAHAPRTHYLPEVQLVPNGTDSNPVPWPSEVNARLLVQITLARVGHVDHVVLPGATFERLDKIYQDPSCPTILDRGKFFGLFALGEAYSNTSNMYDSKQPPGLDYFVAATKTVQNFPERASVVLVEITLLLAFYSRFLNRRHSAYNFVGSALRLSMTLGLQHSLPNYIVLEPEFQQHRVRLWWIVYYCDRIFGSELGHAASIQDSSITVELPSVEGLDDRQKENFRDPKYAVAVVKLARVVGDTMANVYNRHQPKNFIRSVTTVLQDLRDWSTSLPDSLRLPGTRSTKLPPKNIMALHLRFNQCLILVTRPVLLHVLQQRIARLSKPADEPSTTTPLIQSLSNTCIEAAKQVNRLETQSWIQGNFSNIASFDAQCAFSSAIVLAISAVLDPTGADGDLLQTTHQILRNLASHGNFSACEYITHLDNVQQCVDHYLLALAGDKGTAEGSNPGALPAHLSTAAMEETTDYLGIPQSLMDLDTAGSDVDFLLPLIGYDVSWFDPFLAPDQDHNGRGSNEV